MSEQPFEQTLHRLFQDSPTLPDTPLFTARLTGRMERDWTLRRLLIGVTGGGVGLIGLWQFIGQAGVARTLGAVEASTGAMTRNADLARASFGALSQALPYSTEVFWLLGGMLVLAAGLLATRAVDQF